MVSWRNTFHSKGLDTNDSNDGISRNINLGMFPSRLGGIQGHGKVPSYSRTSKVRENGVIAVLGSRMHCAARD